MNKNDLMDFRLDADKIKLLNWQKKEVNKAKKIEEP